MRIAADTRAALRHLGLRLAVLILGIVVLGLPIHDLFRYALLLVTTVLVFTGTVSTNWKRWAAALAVVVAAAAALTAWPAPRIDQGYNFYFPGPRTVETLRLPQDVAQVLGRQFEAEYPAAKRCPNPGANCCRPGSFPLAKGFAFSADALYDKAPYSRRVMGIGFSDPVHLRLGEINNLQYNQLADWCTVRRFKRDRHSLNVFDRFRLLYPLFIVHRFPADFVGSSLCWRGTVIWERVGGHFETIDHANIACRSLQPEDAGRRIFAVSIKRGSKLAMSLHANAYVQVRRVIEYGLMLGGMAALILLLVEIKPRRLRLPALLIGFALLIVVVVDINFIGGFRPLDEGDDGFTYEGYARIMVHHLLAGNVFEMLKGVEPVYYFTPGFRYFRMVERFLFGDTFLGYLSLILSFPFIVLALFRRFLPERWALVMIFLFVATPIGALFGSSFLYYVGWAARGFADPFAFVMLFTGFVLIIPKPAQVDDPRTLTAFVGAVLLAMATFCRPNLILASGMMIACAGWLAATQRRFDRVGALIGGFATLAVSPLHNYVYGHSTVPFSDNVNQVRTLLMSPLDYLKAVGEILRLDFAGPHVIGALQQLGRWLSGPTEILALVPIHAAAVLTLVRIGLFGSRFDPWLRVVALATLLQHGIGICYVNYVRYNLGTWLLTALVAAVWLRVEGLYLFDRVWPGRREQWMHTAWLRWLADRIRRMERVLSPSATNDAPVPR